MSSSSDRIDADFFLLRTPLFPLELLSEWAQGTTGLDAAAGAVNDDELAAALESDRTLLRRRLDRLAGDEHVAAGLALTSPELGEALTRWRIDPASGRARRAECALVRYVTRLASRPDLFGLAGTFSIGHFADDTRLAIPPRSQLDVRVELDAGVLRDLVRRAASESIGDPDLVVRRNPGLYRVGKRLRVAARKSGSTAHRLVEMTPTPAIELALERAGSGASVGALVAALVQAGSPPDHAPDVVSRLIRSELLIPTAEVSVTGPDPVCQAREALASLPRAGGYLEALRRAADGVSREIGRTMIERVTGELASTGVEIKRGRCVHVDVRRPEETRLPQAVLAELRRAVDLLRRINASTAEPLASFAEAFERRFGTRSVPLLQALDPEFGIRLPADGAPPDQRSRPQVSVERRRLLLELLERGRAAGAVELDATDIAVLSAGPGSAQPLPASFGVVTSLRAEDPEAVARGRFQLVEPAVVGSPGVRLLGRLCRTDPELTQLVREHLRREAASSPELVLAELTVAPETDVGLTITQRPLLRGWEIEYGGRSGAPPEARLEPSDLVVSVEDGEVLLHSSSLGRRVVPFSTTAMNPMWVSLPAARFLLSLAGQRTSEYLAWSWADVDIAPSLPRVTTGRTILALRRWNVSARELADIRDGRDAARFRRLHEWRAERGIPRMVGFEHPKSRVLVDFGNALSVDAFLASVRPLDPIRLVEAVGAEMSPLTGPDGRYANELIVPFLQQRKPRRAALRPPPRPVSEPRRRFTPGTEWLYANLYGPSGAADRVLGDHLAPAVRAAREAGLVDRWFFVRYVDPSSHLRVRFHGEQRVLVEDVLPALNEALAPALADGLLYRVSLDTYEREIERYGGLEGVEAMERVATADSDAALAILAEKPSAAARHRRAVASLAALYADSDLELGRRHACCVQLRSSWLPEGARVGDVLGARERAERDDVAAAVAALDVPESSEPWVVALRERSRAITPVLGHLRALDQEGVLERSYDSVMCALAHMAVNRLLRRGGNLDEARVHHALARVYEAKGARAHAVAGDSA